jgi:Zn finger protein HypA/HybF involved in hydrogenase expression
VKFSGGFMADNGELLKQFERVCNCKHEWKFRIEKDGIRKWWCPKCNGIKTEFVHDDEEPIE